MEKTNNINSNIYWDDRFTKDWDALHGPDQSRFFARLALQGLPRWFLEHLRRHALTICDWGCAQGDGTDVLASYVNAEKITGVDFSLVAIDRAIERYPAIKFLNENWLEASCENNHKFDVVFSSNTLEHFHKPYDVLASISKKASKAVVLALPFRELDRDREHFYTFLSNNIPVRLDNGFRLFWSKVTDCRRLENSHWNGDQVILIYAKTEWIDGLTLTLDDLCIEQHDYVSELMQREKFILDRDRLIESLNKDIVDAKHEVSSLSQELMCIKGSLWWRIMSFFLLVKRVITSPGNSAYIALRFLFRMLPMGLRNSLNGPRHAIARRVRGLISSQNNAMGKVLPSDLSWKEFNKKILSNRNQYKGVFIQEQAIDWNVALYQRPQHIAAALGRLGYLVIYRTYSWSDDSVNGFREVAENVWISSLDEVDEIEGVVRSVYSTAFTNTPSSLMKRGKRGKILYEYIDHIDPEISGDKENIRRLLALKEFAFSGGADFIVASARKLCIEAEEQVGSNKVVLVPNGVDTQHYRDPRHLETAVPQSLAEFRRNHEAVVGYFGALAPWLWYDVIAELSKQRPDLGFVFIGPDYYGGSEKIPRSKNVLYMGAVDYKLLPAYAMQFDVCFIPFKPGEIAKTTSPLKLFEYFALEKPVVVSSDMSECVIYDEVFHGASVEELLLAINSALKVKDEEYFKSRLRNLADENDWLQRAKVMESCFEGMKNE